MIKRDISLCIIMIIINLFHAHFTQTAASPHYTSVERRGTLPVELLLQKLDEVNKSVKVLFFFVLLAA